MLDGPDTQLLVELDRQVATPNTEQPTTLTQGDEFSISDPRRDHRPHARMHRIGAPGLGQGIDMLLDIPVETTTADHGSLAVEKDEVRRDRSPVFLGFL